MSNLIIGGQNNVVYDSAGCAWWAEEGVIRWRRPNGEGGTQFVATTLARLQGVADLNRDRKTGRGFKTTQEVMQTQKYIEDMIELCKTARAQGSPENPEATKERIRRSATSISVPGSFS